MLSAPATTKDTTSFIAAAHKPPMQDLNINITPQQIQQLEKLGYSPAQVIGAVFKYIQKQITGGASSPSSSNRKTIEDNLSTASQNLRRRSEIKQESNSNDKYDRPKSKHRKGKTRKNQKLFKAQGVQKLCNSHYKHSENSSSTTSASGSSLNYGYSGSGGKSSTGQNQGSSNDTASCFPAIGFQMPEDVPLDTAGWWCEPDTEYAFLGFSYEVRRRERRIIVSDLASFSHSLVCHSGFPGLGMPIEGTAHR